MFVNLYLFIKINHLITEMVFFFYCSYRCTVYLPFPMISHLNLRLLAQLDQVTETLLQTHSADIWIFEKLFHSIPSPYTNLLAFSLEKQINIPVKDEQLFDMVKL